VSSHLASSNQWIGGKMVTGNPRWSFSSKKTMGFSGVDFPFPSDSSDFRQGATIKDPKVLVMMASWGCAWKFAKKRNLEGARGRVFWQSHHCGDIQRWNLLGFNGHVSIFCWDVVVLFQSFCLKCCFVSFRTVISGGDDDYRIVKILYFKRSLFLNNIVSAGKEIVQIAF